MVGTKPKAGIPPDLNPINEPPGTIFSGAKDDRVIDPSARPSPVSGMDMRTFMGYVQRALNNPEDPGIPPVFMQWVSARLGAEGKNSKDKHNQDFYDFLLRLEIQEHLNEINRHIAKLNEMADYYHVQAQKAAEEMEKIAHRMGERSDFINAAIQLREKEKNTGYFDREANIQLLKSRGIEVDKNISDKDLRNLREQKLGDGQDEQNKDNQIYGDHQKSYEDATNAEEEIRKEVKEFEEEKNNATKNYKGEEAKRVVTELEEKTNQRVIWHSDKFEQDKKAQEELVRKSEQTDIKVTKNINKANALADDDDDLTPSKDKYKVIYNTAANPQKIAEIETPAIAENLENVQKNHQKLGLNQS